MRIAMISTPFLAVPPRDYGGTELESLSRSGSGSPEEGKSWTSGVMASELVLAPDAEATWPPGHHLHMYGGDVRPAERHSGRRGDRHRIQDAEACLAADTLRTLSRRRSPHPAGVSAMAIPFFAQVERLLAIEKIALIHQDRGIFL